MKKINLTSITLFGSAVVFSVCLLLTAATPISVSKEERPNILWVSCEDITPMLGCYDDSAASTPHLDAFAQQAIKYTNAYATAPVCSPARSGIITGVYATSLGSQHLRSHTRIPDSIVPFPNYLKQAGYYVTNNSKEDYNFSADGIWDESSEKAHWRNRKNKRQPFFSVFNLKMTHQSSIFGNDSVYLARVEDYLPYIIQCDPATVELPPYYPDSPGIRKLWVRYYTNVSIIDYQFHKIVEELTENGLDKNTIVFFFSDHGTGMPRSKRALYDSGLKVPLLVYIPPKWQKDLQVKPGTTSHRLISFVDFAPTLLSLAGVDIPEQFEGKSFLPEVKTNEADYVFATSDRVDEAYELSRTLRTKKFRYIRNFMPQLPLLQPNFYTDHSEIMQELNKVEKSTLTPAQQTLFAMHRQPEELYNTEEDPYEINNLAGDLTYRDTLLKLRKELNKQILKIYDTGFMPEPEMIRFSKKETPYALAHNKEFYPLKEILDACNLVLDENSDSSEILKYLNHSNGFVRYWALQVLQTVDVFDKQIEKKLAELLKDEFPTVQMEAARLLLLNGNKQGLPVLFQYLNSADYMALYAARTCEHLSPFFTEVPSPVNGTYHRLKHETDNGKDSKQYYKLYTYWALSKFFQN